MANGAAAADTVRAHHPILIFVTWAPAGPASPVRATSSATAGARGESRRERGFTMR